VFSLVITEESSSEEEVVPVKKPPKAKPVTKPTAKKETGNLLDLLDCKLCVMLNPPVCDIFLSVYFIVMLCFEPKQSC